MSELYPGLHCKACDAPLGSDNDPELCKYCMAVVWQYNREFLVGDEDEFDSTEIIDIENMESEI